jgi:hypothetical protein
MAEFVIGQEVFVPSSRVGLGLDYASAMVKCNVAFVGERTVTVTNVPRATNPIELQKNVVQKRLSFYFVKIGDFSTEEYLLNKLLTIVREYLSIIVMPEYIQYIEIRSLDELKEFWNIQNNGISHLILIGHGTANGFIFGHDSIVTARELIMALQNNNGRNQSVQIISLCCKSGNGNIGKKISGAPFCQSFIGPAFSIHSANAALFCQAFLNYQLLYGYTDKKAYDYARLSMPGKIEFNFWSKTRLRTKKSKLQIVIKK